MASVSHCCAIASSSTTFHTYFGAPVVLQSANLNQSDLRNTVLPSVNLANANLTNANLQNSDLIYADLSGANLHNADLIGARLTGAKLLNTDFQGTDLTKAKLCFVSLLPTRLKDAILTGALITGEGQGFTSEQKQALEQQGAITGGASDRCY